MKAATNILPDELLGQCHDKWRGMIDTPSL